MNFIIYTLLILIGLYFLLRLFTQVASKKISKGLRVFLFIVLIIFAVLFAIGGKFLLTLPFTLASLALLKLKGMSIFQLISLYRLIQTLRNSGRFSFNNTASNLNTMSTEEAYRILNLNPSKNLTKEDVNKAYIKIQKKIHPDISPETSRLSTLVNEAKEIVLRDIALNIDNLNFTIFFFYINFIYEQYQWNICDTSQFLIIGKHSFIDKLSKDWQ